MGWKGALRSYQAAARRSNQAQQRKLRTLAKEAKEDVRRAIHDQSEKVVARYELQISLLTELHRECGPPIDWKEVSRAGPPPIPPPVTTRTELAEQALAEYRPSLIARLFGGSKKATALLKTAIENARREDLAETEAAGVRHHQDCRDVEDARGVADGILRGDTSKYIDVLSETEAFKDDIDSTIQIHAPRADLVTIHLVLPTADKAVPEHEEHLTQRGKLSSKAMPRTHALQLYQHYVCATALRASREILAALPVNWVIANIQTELLDESTGHTKSAPVLSVIAPRRTVEKLNYATVDAVEAMKNFLHRMEFKKTSGLAHVVAFTIDELPTEHAEDARL